MAINFFYEGLKKISYLNKDWKEALKKIVLEENFKLKNINYIITTDEFLLEINQQYLQHNTYTDIITFDNSENPKDIEGDIYISYERIAENSLKFNTPIILELARVMSHGILHLCGYKDKKKEDKILMRAKEDYYISKNFALYIDNKSKIQS